jgi:serine/threonine protein kinase
MSDAEPDPRPDPAEQPTLASGAELRPAGGLVGRPLPCDFGRYRVERLLGRGGMGAVFLATDKPLGRHVALKVPFLSGPDSKAVLVRFLHEAQAAAALSHPNICAAHELGEVDGQPYLVMAYIDGEPLSRRVAPGRPFAADSAVALVRKIALALAEAHARGIVHRDLKPANILIDARGEPILTDFGIARRGDVTRLTQEGDLLGTPAYMSPEQLAGQVDAMGPACDVYSLGVVLYELITGTTPFQGDLVQIASQIALDEPVPPSRCRTDLDPALDAVVLRALAKHPADRWPSMQAFADALGTCLDRSATGDPRGGPLLTLRVAGTPFAYRPLPGQDVVSVGRQKRRPADPPDVGNDFVLRVPNDDPLSMRISRRHFEVRRRGGEFFVVDRSRAGTLLNGTPVPPDAEAPLKSGDRLVVAGVVELEVVLVPGPSAPGFRRRPPVRDAADPTGRVLLEATFGDMVTLE